MTQNALLNDHANYYENNDNKLMLKSMYWDKNTLVEKQYP